MGTRVKAMTVLAVMALTFAILPTFGASAEPLDGDFSVSIPGGGTYDFTVDDGEPTVVPTGATLFFEDDGKAYAGEDFLLIVGDVEYDVVITLDDNGGYVVAVEGPGVDVEDDDPDDQTNTTNTSGGTLAAPTEDEQTGEEQTGEQTGDEAEPHGALVSEVAKCTLNGKDARDANLRTHGYYVSAAAARETVDIGDDSFNLSTMEDAGRFCTLMEQLEDELEAAEDPPIEGESVDEDVGEEDESRGNGNGNGRAKQDDKETGKPDHAGPKDKD